MRDVFGFALLRAVDLQIHRAHRIGQNLTVQVYRYIIKESVEEKIELLKDIKSQRFSALFSNDESPAELGPAGTRLTQEDFDFLLS